MTFEVFLLILGIVLLFTHRDKGCIEVYSQKESKRFLRLNDGCLEISHKKNFKDISFSAPISDVSLDLKEDFTPEEVSVVEKDKSVIGRALVGGIILGPLGAIIGAMSGIGTEKQVNVISSAKNNMFFSIKSGDDEAIYRVANSSKLNARNFLIRFRKLTLRGA